MAKTMKLLIDGIAYTAAMKENTVTDMLFFQNPLELTLKRYDDQEYYAPLKNPLPISGMPLTTAVHAGGLYYYKGFGVFAIAFVYAHLDVYKAVHFGDISEDIVSHLASAGPNISTHITVTVSS